jgi:hypothetical protein
VPGRGLAVLAPWRSAGERPTLGLVVGAQGGREAYAGVTARTVRWYTGQGLLSPVCRSDGGYRLYDAGALAARGSEPEEAVLMHRLARLSAQERRRIVDDFLDDVLARSEADPEFEAGMRSAVPELPDEPSAAQVADWVELAELTGEPDFRRRVGWPVPGSGR